MAFKAVFVVFLAGCVLAGLQLCSAKEKRKALICGTCRHVDRPENCLVFGECRSHEVCEAERIGDHFHLKCGSSSTCRDIENHKNNRRRFLLNLYDNKDCCHESFCNAHLFHKETTTPQPLTTVASTTKTTKATTTVSATTTTTTPCVDTDGVNCTQMLTDGKFCNSVNIGQMYCRKSCNACQSSACADKVGMDCNGLVHDAVNICDHPQSAKLYCAKTCNLCL